ncbi:hypothetical protein DFS34DRAFT_688545 [Phlyctochytrium arcticum]|nr:hypothetical protein DFS34DRAFT_688545 [Phlyctochytrium arcticum]
MSGTAGKTQKEVFVMDKTLRTEIRDTPIPQTTDDQILIRVITASSNPKDWKYIAVFGHCGNQNTGDDIAGYVHAVGKNVYEFKPGDRVAAFHNLGLPTPWRPRKDSDPEIPFIMYGGSTAVGGFALKLAKLSNIHPLITVCGKGQEFVESLKAADHIISYRETKDVTGALKSALGGKKCFYGLDTVSYEDTFKATCAALSPDGKVSTLLPVPPPPSGIHHIITMVGNVHKRDPSTFMPGLPECGDAIDFGHIFYRYLGYLLAQGRISGHPVKMMGGLDKVEEGLKLMQADKISAQKVVYRVAKE